MATLGGNLLQRPRCWYLRNKLTHCLRKGGQRCFAYRAENKYHAILGGGPCYIVHPSDPAVALLALDASVTLAAPSGVRSVPLGEFYLLPREDAQREAAARRAVEARLGQDAILDDDGERSAAGLRSSTASGLSSSTSIAPRIPLTGI